jgi:outer membrane lipoprotein-sorting protein
MKWKISILLIIATLGVTAQTDPDRLVEQVSQKMKLIDNYRADLLIRIDIDFINIKDREATIYFQQPDKFDIKVKGLALMPKKGSQMEYFELLREAHTAIYTGEDTLRALDAHTLKIIPLSNENEIILANIWIGKEDDLIHRMQTYTKTNGSYTLDIFYADHPLNLPDKIRISFEVKGNKLPAMMTGELDQMGEDLTKREVTEGVVWLEYSNYVVNYLK